MSFTRRRLCMKGPLPGKTTGDGRRLCRARGFWPYWSYRSPQSGGTGQESAPVGVVGIRGPRHRPSSFIGADSSGRARCWIGGRARRPRASREGSERRTPGQRSDPTLGEGEVVRLPQPNSATPTAPEWIWMVSSRSAAGNDAIDGRGGGRVFGTASRGHGTTLGLANVEGAQQPEVP
jgi:hypothetical protein